MYNTFATIFGIIFFFLILFNIMISKNLDTPEDVFRIVIVLTILWPLFSVLGLLFPITAPIIFYWTYYLFRKNRK